MSRCPIEGCNCQAARTLERMGIPLTAAAYALYYESKDEFDLRQRLQTAIPRVMLG